MTRFTSPTRRAFLAGGSAAIIAGAAPRAAWGKTQVDVAIIGAGLAGLNAARICEAAGLSVVVLEAESRIGGRLHTLDDLPGKPDAGGIQIGAGYKRLHSIVDELGIPMSSSSGAGAGRRQSPGNLYWIGGKRYTADNWSQDAANPLIDPAFSTEPARLLRKYATGLTQFESADDWLKAAPSSDVSVKAALAKTGASPEALRLIEANFNGNSLSTMSQLHLARSFAIFRAGAGPISTVAGGAQRLPEAMANALKSEVRLNQSVRALFDEFGGINIATAEGAIRARRAICTVPFAAMRNMVVRADLPVPAARMVADLPYTRASFAYISAKTPFWQKDEFPDTIWSDDPLIGRIFVLGDDPPMLKLWTTGSGADTLDRMREDVAAKAIIERIERIRPSARGQLKVLKFFSWQRSPNARGIYHHIGTGMANDLAQAAQWKGSRLHLAGEHLAIENSGMEGALESGERAARSVLSLI